MAKATQHSAGPHLVGIALGRCPACMSRFVITLALSCTNAPCCVIGGGGRRRRGCGWLVGEERAGVKVAEVAEAEAMAAQGAMVEAVGV